jgi:STE24 endopeptidase
MPFVFLLLFALICLQPSWPRWFDWPSTGGCAILAGTLVAASWLSAGLMARTLAWQMARAPEWRGTLMRRYHRFRRWHFIGLLVAYIALLYPLAMGNLLAAWWTEQVPEFLQSKDNLPGFHLALLLPFFAALIAAWERFYLVEKTSYELGHADDHFLTRSAYLTMQVRHQFFLVMPPILLMVSLQILYLFVGGAEEIGDLAAMIMIGIMATALVTMPIFLRLFLGLKPLPPGPLRDRLESAAVRLKFRFSNVLVWNTRHMMANALVTGFVPWIRYVVLTDRLIEELTPDEIEAVFGHEVGHIKHNHLVFYLAFFMTSFILLSIFWDQFKHWIHDAHVMDFLNSPGLLGEEAKELLILFSGVGKLTVLGAYTLLCFGFISRRCERQADLFGSYAVSTEVFISALEKVAVINGIPRDRVGNWLLSWQHPTIAQRVDFLEAMRDNPARVPQFHRSIAMLKWSFLLSLVFLVWWVTPAKVWMVLKEF